MSTSAWLIRAGEGGHRIDDFLRGCVAIGWGEIGPLSDLTSTGSILERLQTAYGGRSRRSFAAAAAVLHKFRTVVAKGDGVATYDPLTRQYLLGSVTSDYRFDPSVVVGFPHVRWVRWTARAARDDLSPRDRHSLGAAFTLFRIPTSTWVRMNEIAVPEITGHIVARAVKEASPFTVHAALEAKVAKVLHEAGIEFRREVPMGGLRPDFVIAGPEGQQIIVEAKTWAPTRENIERAAHQAERYRAATKADQALITLAALEHDLGYANVVPVEQLPAVLQNLLAGKPKKKLPARRTKSVSEDRLIFAAMPFDEKYDDTYLVAMSHAAREVGAACERVDMAQFSGDIVAEIERLIRSSMAVIVDLSELKPNVLYEAGFAHALNKPVVHICSTDLSLLPFDVRNWNTIGYAVGSTMRLREPLTNRLRAVMP